MKSILCMSALALCFGVVSAQDDIVLKPAASFGYLDTDKDARLSRQEARADWAVSQRFAAADANRDGFLDEREFKQLSAAERQMKR